MIFATLGLAASGPGFVTLPTGESAMSPLRWIMFWRFVMGVGIGRLSSSTIYEDYHLLLS